MLLSQYKIRIDPEKTGNTNYLLAFAIDNNKKVGLHCRYGVVEFINDLENYKQAPIATLTLTQSSLVDLFMDITHQSVPHISEDSVPVFQSKVYHSLGCMI